MKDVLIIDQTKPIRVRLCDICSNLNLTTYDAENSSEAMSILSKHSNTIGFIVMEIRYDHFDGIALLERIKKQYDHIPIMILTSSNKRSDFIVGLKAGAFDYVLKPFDDVNLISRIKKLINMSRHTTSTKDTLKSSNVNIKDMIQMEIKKAQKGNYVFVIFMLLIYKPLHQMSSKQDEEYANKLNQLYPELKRLFWETDHLSMFGTQLILGVLPFCDEAGFQIVESKLNHTMKTLQENSHYPSDYEWALSHLLLPSDDLGTSEAALDELQISVRKQVAELKKEKHFNSATAQVADASSD